MLYRKNKKDGRELSILGFGCLRFPKKAGRIHQEEAEKVMKAAIDAGVNYFDTAYTYPGSEACLGRFLAQGYRDQVAIATKLPHYLIKTSADMDKYFEEQKKRLQTDRFEYYLMHMLNDAATWERLKSLGVDRWLERKKASGEIENVGFSFHGGAAQFLPLLDAYDWDFTQIQYNYMDEHTQAGKKGLEYAYQKGIPVMIMEPLRGGKLTKQLPQAAKKEFAKIGTPAEWGLRWIWNHKEVTLVLSGMNEVCQVEENARIASQAQAGHMTEEELAVIERVKGIINASVKVPCTGCGYCMPCPAGVDIPTCFQAYNLKYADGKFAALKNYFMCTALKTNPTKASLCIGCGKCESHCPQSIAVKSRIADVKSELEGPVFKAADKLAKKFVRF
ncbi:MAG: aldo/keto reductase [Eubacterium sp.]|nr:aldo/keto reductase [Eubacterium sp.]